MEYFLYINFEKTIYLSKLITMKSILVSLFFLATFYNLFAQNDFTIGNYYNNGIAAIYKYKDINNQGTYDPKFYGLYNVTANKIILPIKYIYVKPSNETDIFLVNDSLYSWQFFYYSEKKATLSSEKYYYIKEFKDGLAIVAKKINNKVKYGAVNKTGTLVIPLEYSYLDNISEGLICFSKDKGYGYIDYNNKEIIPPLYRSSAGFSEGLACVSLLDSTKYGYIDKKTNWIIQPKYLRGNDFKGNFANVYVNKTNYSGGDNGGIINKTGKEIIPTKYDYITIHDNFFIVKDKIKTGSSTSNKYGILDLDGKVVFPIEYDEINKVFNSDYYSIKKDYKIKLLDKFAKPINNKEYSYFSDFSEANIAYYRTGISNYGVVDKSMKQIIPEQAASYVILGKKNKFAAIQPDTIYVYNSNGKLIKTIEQANINQYSTYLIANDDSVIINYNKTNYLYNITTQKKEKLDYFDVGDFNEDGIFLAKRYNYDFIDYNGKKLNNKSYSNAINFSQDICGLQETEYSTAYLADKTFKKLKDIYNVFIGPYAEGLAKGKAKYGNSVYYFDKEGNTIEITNASDASNFSNGRAYIKDASSSKFYFINKAGKKINTEMYDEVANFSENLAIVKKAGKSGYIDTTGKIVIPMLYDASSSFMNGTAIVKNGNEYYLIDTKGKKINNDVYNNASNPANGSFPVQKGTNFGLINEKGKVIADFKYQDIAPMYEGIAWAKKDGKWGLINDKGRNITEFIYDKGNSCKNGYVVVGIGDKVGLVDKTGKNILPVEYDMIGSVFKDKVAFVIDSGKKTVALK